MSKNIKVEVPKALVSEFINDHQEWVKKGTNRR